MGTVGVRAGGTCLVLLAGCLLAGCATQGVFSDEELSQRTARLRAELADARASLETEVWYAWYANPWYDTPYRSVSGPRGKDGLPSKHDSDAVGRWIKAVKEARRAMVDWQNHNRDSACYYDAAGSAERAASRDAFAQANGVGDRALYDTLCGSSVDSTTERYHESTAGGERRTIRNMGLYLRPWVSAMSYLAKAAEANHGRYLLVEGERTGPYILQQAKSASVVAAEKKALDSLAFARRTRGDPHGVERAQRDAAGRPPLPPWPAPLPKKG